MTQLEYCKRCVNCMQSDDEGKEMLYMICPEFKRKEDETDG